MDQNEEIINRIRDIFIEMNKGTVSEDKIDMYFGKRQQLFYRNGSYLLLYENIKKYG